MKFKGQKDRKKLRKSKEEGIDMSSLQEKEIMRQERKSLSGPGGA